MAKATLEDACGRQPFAELLVSQVNVVPGRPVARESGLTGKGGCGQEIGRTDDNSVEVTYILRSSR